MRRVGLAVILGALCLPACGSNPAAPIASPSPAPSAVPTPVPVPPPSGSVVYFVADPERIQSGEASDLRWECAGDIPDVRIAVLTVPEVVLGPFPARGSVRVRPTRSTAYALWPRSTNNTQAASAHATVFVTP